MKAIRFHDYGGPEVLRYEDAPGPQAGERHVLIRVHAAAVNPADWKIRSGRFKSVMPLPLPLIPGGDIAGVVEAIGPGVTRFRVGDEVVAHIPLSGGYAERAAVHEDMLALKPSTLDFIASASLPLASLTAWQALFEVAELQAAHRILIHAASGGVGGFAVQLAKWKGAEVIGTASEPNHAYLRELGASRCVDYRDAAPLSGLGDLDVVLDLFGGVTGVQSLPLLKPGGIVVSVAGPPAPHSPPTEGRRVVAARVRPDGQQLSKIARLVDDGVLRTVVTAVLPLRDAAKAQQLSEQLHTRGKIVLQVSA